MRKKESIFWNNQGHEIHTKTNVFKQPDISKHQFDILEKYKIKGKRVLEIGPGNGRDIKKFLEYGAKVSAIDIGQKFINELKKKYKGNFIVGDLRQIHNHFAKKTFDIIYSRWSVIHLKMRELKKFIKNCKDLLRKKGIILISLRYGDELNGVHPTTNMQSLSLNPTRAKKLKTRKMRVDLIDVIDSKEELQQITIVLKKN